MSFAADMKREVARIKRIHVAVVEGVEAEAFRSIVEGSEITGAPGQPVASGDLKRSWKMEQETPNRVLIATDKFYAPWIEEGVNMTLRSTEGGFHSVALTTAGMQRIADHVAAQVVK